MTPPNAPHSLIKMALQNAAVEDYKSQMNTIAHMRKHHMLQEEAPQSEVGFDRKEAPAAGGGRGCEDGGMGHEPAGRVRRRWLLSVAGHAG